MSDGLVKRAREALDGVTPGPWRHDGRTGVMASGSVDTHSGVVWATIIRAEQTSETDVERRSWETSGSPDANAHFIAASRELVPAMAYRIEELETKLAAHDAEVYRRGQEDMRERAAEVLRDKWASTTAEHEEAIRAIPIKDKDDE